MGKAKKMKTKEKNNIGSMELDVLCEVLSRLPVKSLCRFKCVSKGWFNLMKDRSFVDLHLRQGPNRRFLRACVSYAYTPSKANFYNIGEEEDDTNVYVSKLVGAKEVSFQLTSPSACNGLLCYINPDRDIQVCNPTTHETITLPKPHFLTKPRFEKQVRLGFGYDPSANQYKFLLCSKSIASPIFQADIFTLGTQSNSSWRKLSGCSSMAEMLLNDHHETAYVPPVYANGAAHWYLTKKPFFNTSGRCFYEYLPHIISFNFAQEKFNLIPVPSDVVRMHACWIFEQQGHICLLERPISGPTIKIWKLNNYHKHQWIPLKLVTTPPLMWVGSPRTNSHGTMLIVRNGIGNHHHKTLYASLLDEQGQAIERTKRHLDLARSRVEIAQFHQESIVSLAGCL